MSNDTNENIWVRHATCNPTGDIHLYVGDSRYRGEECEPITVEQLMFAMAYAKHQFTSPDEGPGKHLYIAREDWPWPTSG